MPGIRCTADLDPEFAIVSLRSNNGPSFRHERHQFQILAIASVTASVTASVFVSNLR